LVLLASSAVRVLYVLRHAKSDWSAAYGGADHERPLNARGHKAARTMGRRLADRQALPDRILCSSAVRTRQTIELVVAAGNWNRTTILEPALYLASPGTVIDLLRDQSDEAHSILIVGHQPTCAELVRRLTGDAPPRFVTAAVACLHLDIASWNEIEPYRGRLIWFSTPRSGDWTA
jgi:phosphohistidine phosphatase